MKILLFSNKFFPDIGGIETIASLLAHDFADAGHEVRLVTKTREKSRLDQALPFRILRCPNLIQLFLSYHWAHVVLQVNLEARQLWPQFLFSKPLVIGMQCWSDSTKASFFSIRRLKHMALGLADRLIACSNAIKEETGYPATVIGNPYASDLFCRDPDISRKKSIVFLGRLVNLKGADMLLQGFAALQPSGWRLTIIGDGPDRSVLERSAFALGLQSSVDFLGQLQGDSLVRVLNQHEIMVVPSRWREPFGIVALEGLACGCVVLAADEGGLVDAVGPAGLVFRRGDQDDFNSKLDLLVRDNNLREKLCGNAATHLRSFRHQDVSQSYLSVLQQAIEARH